jgi:hypothetical protein
MSRLMLLRLHAKWSWCCSGFVNDCRFHLVAKLVWNTWIKSSTDPRPNNHVCAGYCYVLISSLSKAKSLLLNTVTFSWPWHKYCKTGMQATYDHVIQFANWYGSTKQLCQADLSIGQMVIAAMLDHIYSRGNLYVSGVTQLFTACRCSSNALGKTSRVNTML